MRFDHIKARNIGPFKGIDIDFGAIPGLLVAVTGENGAGKSSLLELLSGAMYRKTPTRGSLVDLATGRDSYLEVSMANGAPYTIRHTLDCISKKSEAVVMDGVGAALTEGAKVRSVDAWVEQHMPTPEVLYTSTFSPQGSGGFMELSPADRKRVLLRVLGVERLEVLAEQARKNATEATTRARLAQARLDDERGRTLELSDAEIVLWAAQGRVGGAGRELEAAEKAARDAERAAEAAERAAAERRSLVERMGQLDVEALSVERRHDAAQRLAGRTDEVRAAREQLAAVEASLVTARAELARAREHVAAEQERETQRLAHGERLRVLRGRQAHLQDAVAGYDRDMLDAAEVEAAQAALPESEATFARVEAEVYRLQGARDALQARYVEQRTAIGEALHHRDQAAQRLNGLELAAAGEEAARAREARRVELDAERARLIAARDEAVRRSTDLRTRIMSSKDERIRDLREALVEIADGGVSPTRAVNLAAETLSADHVARVKAESAPAELQALEDSRRVLVERLDVVEREQWVVRDAPRQLADVEAAIAALPGAREDLVAKEDAYQAARLAVETTVSEGQNIRDAVNAAHDALDTSRKRLSQLRRAVERSAVIVRAAASRAAALDELAQIKAEAKRLQVLAEYDHLDPGSAGVVAATGATVADLERQAEGYRAVLADADAIAAAGAEVEAAQRDRLRIETALAELRGQLAALPELPAVDVYLAQAAAQQATVAHQAAQRELIAAEQQVEQARAGAERIAALEATLAKELDEVSDWTRLGQDLGRDGIQALEIDAAGPELTAIANDLLHTCVSRRWTMEVRTQRASADGKRQLEGCDVVVIDTERGREGEAETFSGGERVLLGEALSLALSVLACRRHGVVGPTLVRDESGAALDAGNGRAYVAMLRRAGELIGASQILFVSHNVELQELADARIHVADGCATVIGGAL